MSAALASFESPRDQWRALAWSLGVHLLALGTLVVGLWMSMPEKPVIAGQPIEAVLVDMPIGKTPPRAAPAPPKPTPPPPKPEPKPEPAPPPPPPQATPDDVTDQRPVLPSVPDVDAMNLQREQEEQLRREQEELRRQQELEQQRMQQLEDIRRQREDAARRAEEQAQQLAQLRESQRVQDILNTAAVTEEPEGSVLRGENVEDSLLSQYVAAIQTIVTANWRRPVNTPVGIRCVLQVRQIPGGDVISVSIGSPCNADPLVQQSILEAVQRTGSLPYDGFESVFRPQLNFNFRYDG